MGTTLSSNSEPIFISPELTFDTSNVYIEKPKFIESNLK